MARIGGIVQVKVNGVTQFCKGDFTKNMGIPTRKSVMGSDGLNHGHTETPQPASLKGKITKRMDLDLVALVKLENATVIFTEGDGTSTMFHNAKYTGTGDVSSAEGEVDFAIEADSAEPL